MTEWLTERLIYVHHTTNFNAPLTAQERESCGHWVFWNVLDERKRTLKKMRVKRVFWSNNRRVISCYDSTWGCVGSFVDPAAR